MPPPGPHVCLRGLHSWVASAPRSRVEREAGRRTLLPVSGSGVGELGLHRWAPPCFLQALSKAAFVRFTWEWGQGSGWGQAESLCG